VFVVTSYKNEYKLICSKRNELAIYLIEDIEEFLKFINIDELVSVDQDAMTRALENVKPLPATGVAIIQNDKLFLYDFRGYEY
jgi:hypothetical protein